MRINTTHSLFWILLMFSFLFALSVLLLTYSLSFSVDFLFSCASVHSSSRSFLTDAGLSLSLSLFLLVSVCVRACELYIYVLMKIKQTFACPSTLIDFFLRWWNPYADDTWRRLLFVQWVRHGCRRRRTGFSFRHHFLADEARMTLFSPRLFRNLREQPGFFEKTCFVWYMYVHRVLDLHWLEHEFITIMADSSQQSFLNSLFQWTVKNTAENPAPTTTDDRTHAMNEEVRCTSFTEWRMFDVVGFVCF